MPGGVGRVAVLGLSFKAGTDVATESPSFMVIERLLERGIAVVAFDRNREAVSSMLGNVWGYRVSVAETAEEAVRDVDAVLIAVDDEHYATAVEHLAHDVNIVDPWDVRRQSFSDSERLGSREALARPVW